MAQSMKQIDSSEAERPVFESLAQCAWAWDIMLKYAESLQKVCQAPGVTEELFYLNQVGYNAMVSSIGETIKKYHES